MGIHSSFFESGGNSLSVVRLQSRINQAFDVKLTISQLFTHHTIACQAEVLQSSGREKVNVERGRSKGCTSAEFRAGCGQ
ncbi:acyl carrier protein [Paenibacillus rhizoplanae]